MSIRLTQSYISVHDSMGDWDFWKPKLKAIIVPWVSEKYAGKTDLLKRRVLRRGEVDGTPSQSLSYVSIQTALILKDYSGARNEGDVVLIQHPVHWRQQCQMSILPLTSVVLVDEKFSILMNYGNFIDYNESLYHKYSSDFEEKSNEILKNHLFDYVLTTMD